MLAGLQCNNSELQPKELQGTDSILKKQFLGNSKDSKGDKMRTVGELEAFGIYSQKKIKTVLPLSKINVSPHTQGIFNSFPTTWYNMSSFFFS